MSAQTSTVVNKTVEPFVDCGRLLLIDRDPITEFGNEDQLITRARDNVQFLFNQIWELDKKRVEDSIVAVLPKPVYKLPREKICPEKKTPTRWEEYAKLKGIKPNKKRNNKIYDETSGEWKPRYGYRRAKEGTEKDWLIEVPENRGDDVDMFAERKQEKKERVAKNEVKRLKNMARATTMKANKRSSAPVEIAKVGMAKDVTERTKQDVRVTVDRTRAATASLGKFQEKIHGEKVNTKTGKKRKFEPNIQSGSEEKEKALNVIKGVLTKKPRLLDHKMASTAGALSAEEGPRDASKSKRGGDRMRQKSSIHRQQHFQKKVRQNKKTIGNAKGRGGGGQRPSSK